MTNNDLISRVNRWKGRKSQNYTTWDKEKRSILQAIDAKKRIISESVYQILDEICKDVEGFFPSPLKHFLGLELIDNAMAVYCKENLDMFNDKLLHKIFSIITHASELNELRALCKTVESCVHFGENNNREQNEKQNNY